MHEVQKRGSKSSKIKKELRTGLFRLPELRSFMKLNKHRLLLNYQECTILS
jgi:hypothetical protein